MIYQSVSIKPVIARVIRNTRTQDSSYTFDMNEWIPEAMGYMKTQVALSSKYKDIEIDFHKGILPCSLHTLIAVSYQGCRLPEGNKTRAYDSINLPNHRTASYNVEMGFITTSFSSGSVRLYYDAQPTDDDGLPLIPDNEDYKEALYYYCRAKMIGTGYKDTVFNEERLMERFEKHAARAVAQITYPSLESMERKVTAMVRFLPQENYYEGFFDVSPEGGYPTQGRINDAGDSSLSPSFLAGSINHRPPMECTTGSSTNPILVNFTNQSHIEYIHNLNRLVVVSIADNDGNQLWGEVNTSDSNKVVVNFNKNYSGTISIY